MFVTWCEQNDRLHASHFAGVGGQLSESAQNLLNRLHLDARRRVVWDSLANLRTVKQRRQIPRNTPLREIQQKQFLP